MVYWVLGGERFKYFEVCSLKGLINLIHFLIEKKTLFMESKGSIRSNYLLT